MVQNYCLKGYPCFLGTLLRHKSYPQKMKDLIQNILAIPVGSADVERAFSILTHIRDSRRSQLTAEHIEDALRIRMNFPEWTITS